MDEIKVKITEPLFHWRPREPFTPSPPFFKETERNPFSLNGNNNNGTLKINKQKKEKLIFK